MLFLAAIALLGCDGSGQNPATGNADSATKMDTAVFDGGADGRAPVDGAAPPSDGARREDAGPKVAGPVVAPDAAADLGRSNDLGTGAPRLSVTPSTQPANLGEAAVGRTGAPKYFTILNTGGGKLEVASDDPQFVLAVDRCSGTSLAGSCQIGVALRPTTTGTLIGTILISDGIDGQLSIAVTGTGLPYCLLTESPEFIIEFGGWPVGQTSPAKTLTITNTGTTPSGALVVSLDQNRFTLRADTCSGVSLAPGESCHLEVAFKAVPMSTDSKLLIVPEVGAPLSVRLTGMGISSNP